MTGNIHMSCISMKRLITITIIIIIIIIIGYNMALKCSWYCVTSSFGRGVKRVFLFIEYYVASLGSY